MRKTLVATELPGYQSEIGAALWRLADARRRTLRLLNDMPAEHGGEIGSIIAYVS